MMLINSDTINSLKRHIEVLLRIVHQYKYLTDSYIIEFFVDHHWSKLPWKWREVLKKMQPSDAARELFCEKPNNGDADVLPLSLLAFKACCLKLGLSRKYDATQDENEFGKLNPSQSKLMAHIFRKHVKPKKQHEIRKLSEIIVTIASETKATRIVDIGSGQGHLSRLLTIGHDLRVSSVESDSRSVDRARIFDAECVKTAFKDNPDILKVPPTHTVQFIQPFLPPRNFLNIFENVAQDEKILLTGLHACGDLSATMIDTFVNCDNVKALISIACCYMKLSECETEVISTSESTKTKVGYPMSDFVKKLRQHSLDYKSREISCHANENFAQRLIAGGNHLKVHCYRAVLESLIREKHPDMVRPGVQTSKKAHLLPFPEYTKLAFVKLHLLPVPDSEICCESVGNMLADWWKVVIFYALCLLLAPLIETVILLDRAIFLYENGINSKIECIFDPKLSPRCFALIATKIE